MTDKTLDDILRLWRPTQHYGRLLSEGRNRPAPSIGSPTFIWHLAIWRKRIEGSGEYTQTSTKQNVKKYVEHNRKFFHEISRFLRQLQDRGLVSPNTPQDITLSEIPIPGGRNDGTDPFDRFEVFLPQSLNFELWWLDGADKTNPNKCLDPKTASKEEIDGATRVLVQFQSFQDHITCTFYIDIAQKFNGTQILDADELSSCGARKRKVGDILHVIRQASLGQISSGAINAPDPVASDDAAIPKELQLSPERLRDAIKYAYEEIWDEFQGAFGFELASAGAEDLKFGVVFVNLRGLLMAHRGLDTPADKTRRLQISRLRRMNSIAQWGSIEPSSASPKRPWKPSERTAGDTLGPVDLFDNDCSEAEVVLRSFGPFLEEMSPGVPDRDWVGCGILDWRAIFVSPLGSRAEVSVDGRGLPLSEPTNRHWSERFLVLSKGEPNKQQIGRFVERILSLETMRTFALRNLGLIQNCYHYLGVLTFELDNVLKFWNGRRKFLKDRFGIRRTGDVALEHTLDTLKAFVDTEILKIENNKTRVEDLEDIVAERKERLYYELLSL